ncbi:MAG: hypothetical protein R3B84_02120 [Zavarzinella sp.]
MRNLCLTVLCSVFIWWSVVPKASCQSKPPLTAGAISNYGKWAIVGSQAGLDMYDWPGLQHQKRIKTKMPTIHDLKFSPDGKTLAVVGGDPGKRGSIELYQLPAQNLLSHKHLQRDTLYCVDWSDDGKYLAVAGLEKITQVIEANDLKVAKSFEGHSKGVLACHFVNNSSFLATAGLDQSLRIWDISSRKLARSFSNHTQAIVAIAVRPELPDAEKILPTMVTASTDRTVRLWQPTIGRMVRFARLKETPVGLCWLANATLVAVVTDGGNCLIIDPDSMEIKETHLTIEGRPCLLSPARDGSLLVAGEDGKLCRIVPKLGK